MGLWNIAAEKYGMDTQETILAGMIKYYLYCQPEEMAWRIMREVVACPVVQVDFRNRGSKGHAGGATPLQVNIDGAKLAALIDAAQTYSQEAVSDMSMGDQFRLSGKMIGLDGKTAVQRISVSFCQFIGDCYEAVREDVKNI